MHIACSTFAASALLLAPAALAQSLTKLTVNANGVHSSYDSAVGVSPDSVTPDGRYTVFSSGAWQLIPNLLTFYTQVYLYDTLAGTTRLVSWSPTSGPGSSYSAAPAVTDDGRFVAYESRATNLVPGPWRGYWQIYLTDLQSGVTSVVSLTNHATPALGNADSSTPSISGDGSVVAFASEATSFVLADSNGTTDVFVRDLVANTTRAVSRIPGGSFGDGTSKAPAVSGDGRFVAFETLATNLAPGATATYSKILVRDLATGTFEHVSVNSAGVAADAAAIQPSITSDGSRIAFLSTASNLANTSPGLQHAYVHDRTTGITTRIDVLPNGASTNGVALGVRLSDNGLFASLISTSSSLTTGHVGLTADAFVVDLTTQVALRASVPLNLPGEPNQGGISAIGNVSDDGRFTAIQSNSTNLLAGEPVDGVVDVYLRDSLSMWYRDLDGDLYGDAANFLFATFQPGAGYVSIPGDCDDTNPAVHPGAIEICNVVDDDCDGDIDELVWSSYCTAATSVAGCVPTVSATGVPSASNASGFFVQASLLPGGKQAIAVYGLAPTAAVYAFGNLSFLCVAAPRQRTLNLPTGGAAGLCNGSYSLDWLAWMSAHPTALGQPLQAGQTIYSQVWYRDPGAILNSNLTDGVVFTLCP
ncbi:MAG: PD40 domain-containing protein [Planctomycetaceae bacterium]|nr:PD40 domain-containing protein [Planctomycetaceae bacterium]